MFTNRRFTKTRDTVSTYNPTPTKMGGLSLRGIVANIPIEPELKRIAYLLDRYKGMNYNRSLTILIISELIGIKSSIMRDYPLNKNSQMVENRTPCKIPHFIQTLDNKTIGINTYLDHGYVLWTSISENNLIIDSVDKISMGDYVKLDFPNQPYTDLSFIPFRKGKYSTVQNFRNMLTS